jgi:hypothetical protein
VKPKDVLQAPQQQKRAYASYAEATASDQVSGITDSEPSPRDAKHEEISTRIASLEAMITTLVYQVQQLTSIAPATQGNLQAPDHTEVPYPQGKRQDVKVPKNKRSHDPTADSEAKEGSKKDSAPVEEHPFTSNDTNTVHRREHTTAENISTTIYSQQLPYATTQPNQQTPPPTTRNRLNPRITPDKDSRSPKPNGQSYSKHVR